MRDIKAAQQLVPSADTALQQTHEPAVVDHSLSFTWPTLKLHLAAAWGPMSTDYLFLSTKQILMGAPMVVLYAPK